MENEKRELLKIRDRYKNSLKPGVSIIVPTNKPKYMNNIFNNYRRCSYENKEMIVIINNDNINLESYINLSKVCKNVTVKQLKEEITLGQCLNYGVSLSRYNYIAKMDDDDYYGENYLLDQMNAFKYVDADIIGKAAYFVYYEKYNSLGTMYPNLSNKYTPYISGSTLLIKKKVFGKVKFRNINLAEDINFIRDCAAAKFNIYSSNKYNYAYLKHKDIGEHTWKIEATALFKISRNITSNKDFLTIITA